MSILISSHLQTAGAIQGDLREGMEAWFKWMEEIAPLGVLAASLRKGKANIDLHLPENEPVKIHLKLGEHKPLDWIYHVS